MPKYVNFAIVASFFGLWINSILSKEFQLFIGFLLIFTFGILHGANDLLLIKNIREKNKPIPYYKMLNYYLAVVLFGALLFYIIPWFALLIFVLVSGFHFGQQQWQNLPEKISSLISSLFQFNYGIFILLLLFVFHTKEVQEIIFEISSIYIEVHYFLTLLEIFGVLLALMSIYFAINSKIFRDQAIIESFYLLVYTILFKSSSLIWGFSLYFILWHSIPSIIDQIKFLKGQFNFRNFVAYCRSAFYYWIFSLLGIAILYLLFIDQELFNALFFSFLAAITFPHAIVILKMYQNKS